MSKKAAVVGSSNSVDMSDTIYARPQAKNEAGNSDDTDMAENLLNDGCFTKEAAEMSHVFAREYRQVCSEKGCHFFDAASVAQASDEDKLHMTAAEHGKLAEALAPVVKGCLADGNGL